MRPTAILAAPATTASTARAGAPPAHARVEARR